jgi:hypothetical protein
MNYNYNTFFPVALSTTSDLEIASTCMYKWFLMRCAKFTSRGEGNIDLDAGSGFARAMELTREAYYKQGLSAEEAVNVGRKHILEEYGKTFAEQHYQHELKTPSKLDEVFERMFHEHPLDHTSVTPFEMTDGSISVEQDFSTELPFTHPETGKPLILKCKLDMLGTRNNLVYVVDEKTTKSVLTDDIKQTNLLRTQNQFVQYVTVANHNKEKFGDLEVTHVLINKCVIKNKYAANEEVIHPYEFRIDVWFQKTWWNNMLALVEDMLTKYQTYKALSKEPEQVKQAMQYQAVFPRNYSHGCTLFYRPCQFTNHCTSGNHQDLFAEGFSQIVCDSTTERKPVPLGKYIREVLGEDCEQK